MSLDIICWIWVRATLGQVCHQQILIYPHMECHTLAPTQVTKFPNNHHPERFQLSIFIPITEKYPKDLIGRRAKLLLYMSRGGGMGERSLPGIFFQKNIHFLKACFKKLKNSQFLFRSLAVDINFSNLFKFCPQPKNTGSIHAMASWVSMVRSDLVSNIAALKERGKLYLDQRTFIQQHCIKKKDMRIAELWHAQTTS